MESCIGGMMNESMIQQGHLILLEGKSTVCAFPGVYGCKQNHTDGRRWSVQNLLSHRWREGTLAHILFEALKCNVIKNMFSI